MNKGHVLGVIRQHASRASSEIRYRDYYIRVAIQEGASIRETGRAAGVSARTVQRIAERERDRPNP